MSVDLNSVPPALALTAFQLPGQTAYYKGKVRDVYTIGKDYLVMVISDRISAFDVVLPRPIPFKGQVLNQIAAYMLKATSDILPNWLIEVPDPNVSIGWRCEPYKVEMVIRGYLTGHAWREYKKGKRVLCGVSMPEGMRENERFVQPIITPTTKASEGHDMDISREEIISSGLMAKEEYEQLEKYTLELYKRGSELADKQGLILVDTKYEFGKREGAIVLMDEIHTPDSSRYFYKDGYDERLANNAPQRQLSKEFVREWLMENGFQGREGEQVPVMSDDWLLEISGRYIELYEQLTGQKFSPRNTDNMLAVIEHQIRKALLEIS